MLDKREALLMKKIDNELQKARELNRQGNKRAALQCLKRKKLYESQQEVVANQQLKLQEQMIVLEGSKATAETFNALKSGAGAMKQLAKETDVDKVDKVMDEISEQTEKMRQVNEALGQQVGYAAELDEDELEAELAELDALDVEDALLTKEIEELEPGFSEMAMPDVPKPQRINPKIPSMPSSSTSANAKVKKIASTEEEELEALRLEMELLG
jgi:charged multivesicular body protein 4A/B